MNRTYYVYILASRSRTLYTGVTKNLERRIVEHRDRSVPGFTTRYNILRLVHFEAFSDIRSAIAREKEIKGWRREKKIWLIQRHNRTWEDLAERFAGDHGRDVQSRSLTPVPAKRGRVRDDTGGLSGGAVWASDGNFNG
jgi:putative endonuclease